MSWPDGTLVNGEAQGGSGALAITALTGDVSATGPGSVAATLANTAVTPGTYGDSTHVSRVTVDAKGRLTAVSEVAISYPSDTGITQLTGDVTAGPGSGSQAATIGANKVLTAMILDKNVTLAKIADLAAAKVLGSIAGGTPAALSITQVLDLITGTPAAGDIIYRDASTWLRLPAGTASQVLQANGVAAPSWVTPTAVSVLKVRKVLTNAEILQLSTTPITILAAQGANTIITPISCRVYANLAGGTIGGGIGVSLRYAAIATDLTNVSLNALLNNGIKTVTLIPVTQSNDPGTDYVNVAVVLKGNANGTTGNAANFCVVEMSYTVTLVTNTP